MIKQVVLFPLRLFNTVIGPLAGIQHSPILAKADAMLNDAIFHHEMSPLGEQAHQSHLETTAQMEMKLGIPALHEHDETTVKLNATTSAEKKVVKKNKISIAKIVQGLDRIFAGKKNEPVIKDDLSYRTTDDREAL